MITGIIEKYSTNATYASIDPIFAKKFPGCEKIVVDEVAEQKCISKIKPGLAGDTKKIL